MEVNTAAIVMAELRAGWRLWPVLLAGIAWLFVVLLASTPATAEEEMLRISDFRMAGDINRTRIAVHFSQETELNWFLLRGPYRLVIDLPAARFAFEPESTKAGGLVNQVRYGHFDRDHTRLILGSDSPFRVERLEMRPEEDGTGHFLSIDIVSASGRQFDKQLAERAGLQKHADESQNGGANGGTVQTAQAGARPFTLVIDPGHGGIDGGARGVSGTEEKTVTLAFALELRDKLREIDDIRVIMTREQDKFLRLRERVRVARQNEADLFISIHADTIRYREIRGATVYTVSSSASDKMAAEIAESENLADLVAGIPLEEAKGEVTDILLDLLRRETQSFSISFARSLIGEMSSTIEMIKNPHRFAGFQVLTAPDVPSVLLELGYLSNPKDEEALRDPQWRDRAADSIVAAILRFAEARANGMGG